MSVTDIRRFPMRVFVTGASGHIGIPVVSELISAGHSVVGLARSDASAALVKAAGAEVLRATIDDTDALRNAAKAADGVIHLAFRHDIAFTGDYAGAMKSEVDAVTAMGDALGGTGKAFVGTSGTLAVAHTATGRTGTEADVGSGPRVPSESSVLAFAEKGVRTSVVRLAPTVHSSLDHHGFVPSLIQMARKNGFAAYVGEGTNRWPAVHTLDAARLYRLAVESAPAGSRLHGNAEEGVPFRQIAEAIGKGLGLPAR